MTTPEPLRDIEEPPIVQLCMSWLNRRHRDYFRVNDQTDRQRLFALVDCLSTRGSRNNIPGTWVRLVVRSCPTQRASQRIIYYAFGAETHDFESVATPPADVVFTPGVGEVQLDFYRRYSYVPNFYRDGQIDRASRFIVEWDIDGTGPRRCVELRTSESAFMALFELLRGHRDLRFLPAGIDLPDPTPRNVRPNRTDQQVLPPAQVTIMRRRFRNTTETEAELRRQGLNPDDYRNQMQRYVALRRLQLAIEDQPDLLADHGVEDETAPWLWAEIIMDYYFSMRLDSRREPTRFTTINVTHPEDRNIQRSIKEDFTAVVGAQPQSVRFQSTALDDADRLRLSQLPRVIVRADTPLEEDAAAGDRSDPRRKRWRLYIDGSVVGSTTRFRILFFDVDDQAWFTLVPPMNSVQHALQNIARFYPRDAGLQWTFREVRPDCSGKFVDGVHKRDIIAFGLDANKVIQRRIRVRSFAKLDMENSYHPSILTNGPRVWNLITDVPETLRNRIPRSDFVSYHHSSRFPFLSYEDEPVANGSLADTIAILNTDQNRTYFPETFIWFVLQNLLLACEELRARHIRPCSFIHTSIRPKTTRLRDQPTQYGVYKEVVISGPDHYKILEWESVHGGRRGVRGFEAPESIEATWPVSPYAADVYLIGQLIFGLMRHRAAGFRFRDKRDGERFEELIDIANDNVSYDELYSVELEELVASCLVEDPRQRTTFYELLDKVPGAFRFHDAAHDSIQYKNPDRVHDYLKVEFRHELSVGDTLPDDWSDDTSNGDDDTDGDGDFTLRGRLPRRKRGLHRKNSWPDDHSPPEEDNGNASQHRARKRGAAANGDAVIDRGNDKTNQPQLAQDHTRQPQYQNADDNHSQELSANLNRRDHAKRAGPVDVATLRKHIKRGHNQVFLGQGTMNFHRDEADDPGPPSKRLRLRYAAASKKAEPRKDEIRILKKGRWKIDGRKGRVKVAPQPPRKRGRPRKVNTKEAAKAGKRARIGG